MSGKRLRQRLIGAVLAVVMTMGMLPLTTTSAEGLTFDGTQSEWAEPELQDAYDYGLTYPEIMKNYKSLITREEFCTIVVKLYEALSGKEAEAISPNPFSDTSNPEILKANKLKIVFGTSDDKFTPYANITRQEICVMIFRALSAAVEELDKSEPSVFNYSDAAKIADWAYSAVRFCVKNGIMRGTTDTTIDPLSNTTREQAIALLRRTFVSYHVPSSNDDDPVPISDDDDDDDDDDGDPKDDDNNPDPPPEEEEASKPKLRDSIISIDPGFTIKDVFVAVFDYNEPEEDTTPPPTSVPAKPSDLVLVSNKSQPAPKITWKDNATDETEYEVIRRLSSTNSDEKVFTLPKNSTSYIDNDAKPGILYKYVVRCKNEKGYSGFIVAHVKAFKEGEGDVATADMNVNKALKYIGYGYNAFGDYASPDTSKGLKQPVLDYQKMVEWREINKTPNANADSFFENIESNAYDYCKKSTTNVKVSGGFMGFSASVNTNFGSMNSTSKNKYLATQTKWVKLYEYSLADPIYFDYSNFLLPSVQKALNDPNVSPAQILDTYGTHVMTSVWIGGRMDYNCSIESQSSESFSSFKMNAKASYSAGFTSASVGVDTATEKRIKNFNSKTTRNVIFYGGTGSTGKVMNPDQAADAMDAWRNSLNNDPTFTDFGGQPLKPIWELCSTQARRDAIKAEFDKRANSQKSLFPLPKYVTGIHFPTQNIGWPDYTSTGGININPKGNGNFLFYLLGENEAYAYTDFFITYHGKNPPAYEWNASVTPWKIAHNSDKDANFYLRSGDLRKGAGSKSGYVLFFGTRDKTKSPIKRMDVLRVSKRPDFINGYFDEEGWEYVTLLNETEPFDLRKDLKGDCIYIRFMRE